MTLMERRRALIGMTSEDIVLLASGTYNKTDSGTTLSFPVTYSGTPKYVWVHESEAIPGTPRAISWQAAYNVKYDTNYQLSKKQFGVVQSEATTGTHPTPAYTEVNLTASQLTCSQQSSNYPVVPNTYIWEIWGCR